MRSTVTLPLLSASLLAAFSFACFDSDFNPDHCYYADGDETCVRIDPKRPFCARPECASEHYGCVAEQPEPECYSRCGGDECWSSDDEDAEPAGEVGACSVDSECPADAPVCDAGECKECREGEDQVCVALSLACDLERKQCVTCDAHDQCPGEAGCDLATGACLPASQVWHVDGDGGRDFTSIAAALDVIGPGSGTIILHAHDDPDFYYGDKLMISGPRALAVLNYADEIPQIQVSGATGLSVSMGARFYGRGLRLSADRGIEAISDAQVELDRCWVLGLEGEALYLLHGDFIGRNTVLRNWQETGDPAIYLYGESSIEGSYLTVLAQGDTAPIACPATIPAGSSVRNSLVATLGPLIPSLCDQIQYLDNGLEETAGFPGNTEIPPVGLEWFVGEQVDLHLSAAAPTLLATAGRWREGDPAVDIDGEPRPTRDGSPDFVGADRR